MCKQVWLPSCWRAAILEASRDIRPVAPFSCTAWQRCAEMAACTQCWWLRYWRMLGALCTGCDGARALRAAAFQRASGATKLRSALQVLPMQPSSSSDSCPRMSSATCSGKDRSIACSRSRGWLPLISAQRHKAFGLVAGSRACLSLRWLRWLADQLQAWLPPCRARREWGC